MSREAPSAMHVALVGLHDDGKYALSVRYAASTTAASTDAPRVR